MHNPGTRLAAALVRRITVVVAVAALGLVGAGCTGPDQPDVAPGSPTASEGTTTTLQPRPAPARVRVTRVAGRMPPKDRRVLAAKVGKVVATYFDDAFLGGSQPRTRFSGAFATFTRDAGRQARRQQRLMTNAALGPTTEAVVARRQHAFLSVLAPKGVAAGVSARVDLVYLVRRVDRPDRLVSVRGRLLLTRVRPGKWKIFGYDLTRDVRATGEGA